MTRDRFSRALIFSGSRELYLTTIQFEVASLLAAGFVVDIFLEHPDVSNSLDSANVNYHVKSHKRSELSEFCSLAFFFKRKKFVSLVKKLIKQGCNALIIHNEMESYANLASQTFFNQKLDIYIIKPSPIISIDSDWLWLRHLTSKSRWFLDKLLFEIVVPFFIFRRILLTNKRWVPSNFGTIKKYCGPARGVMCYDDHSRIELSKYFSSIARISFPAHFQTSSHSRHSLAKKMLVVPSNDAWFYASINNVSIREAKNLIYKFLYDFCKKCHNNNMIVEIKFKYEWQVFEFNLIYGDVKNIRTFYEGNVYSLATDYKYVAGFNTTVLMYLKLMGYQGALISLQLVDHKFYSWYRNIEGIEFFKSIEDVSFSTIKLKNTVETNLNFPSLTNCLERRYV